MEWPVRVLLVDDDPGLASRAAERLEQVDGAIAAAAETDAEAALDRLADEPADCVVCGYDASEADGVAFLEAVRADHPDLPIVLFGDAGAVAGGAVAAGVADYLRKGIPDQYEALADRIESAVGPRDDRECLEETVMEAIGDPVYALDAEGRFTFVNDAYAEFTGYGKAELLGEHASLVVDEEGVETAREHIGELLERGERTGVYEFELTTKDGERKLCEDHLALLPPTDGGFRGNAGVIRDVTERAERERRLDALHRAARRLMAVATERAVATVATETARDILGLPLNAVWLYDEAERALVPVTSTPENRQVLGDLPTFPEGEGLAWEVFETRDPQVHADVSADPDAYNPETPIRSEFILPLGGHGVFIAGSTVVGDFDEADVALAQVLAANVEVALDRTERDRALRRRGRAVAALHGATRRLMEAETAEEVATVGVEAADDILGLPYSSVFLRDDEDGVLRAAARTEEAAETLGQPPTFRPGEGIVGHAFETGETVMLDDAREDERGLEDGSSVIRSYCVIPLGEYGAFVSAAPEVGVFDDNDVDVANILATNIEAALDRAEREGTLRDREAALTRQNRRLEEFASIVSHDLRNPLNVATGRLGLVREECDSPHLDEVARAHDRMEALIDDVLALARKGQAVGEAEPVALDAVARQAWATAGSESGSDAELAVGDLGSVEADEERLCALLENLFRNAVEHGARRAPEDEPAGDAVEHGARRAPDRSPPGDADEHAEPRVTVRVGMLDDGFFVEDDGPGIPPEDRERVFERGYTTADGGTGFGLAIVREIAEAHGWEVRVVEAEAGGARFEVHV